MCTSSTRKPCRRWVRQRRCFPRLIKFLIHTQTHVQDLCFRILNKEWEYSHKKGFKSTYDRGILHLYFNFKRQRYRR